MEIENKSGKSKEHTWYKEGGYTFTAKADENGYVRIDLKCGVECKHKEVSVTIGFGEYSSIGSRRMWTDEMINTAMGRRE